MAQIKMTYDEVKKYEAYFKQHKCIVGHKVNLIKGDIKSIWACIKRQDIDFF